MTNLNHLHVISTICELGSFQLASEKLNKARPAVSYSVKQVEEYYQIQIFDRSKYRPELTPDGKLLLARIQRLLGQAQEFEDFVQELKGEVESELRLGVSSIFPIKRLSGLLKSLRSNFPSTTIHLEYEVETGERLLLAEKVDLAIFAAPQRHMQLDYKSLDQMLMPLVISPECLTVPTEEMTRAGLEQHPQIVVKSADAQSPDTGLLAGAQKWYVTDLSAKKELICEGVGWGRLPGHMVKAEISQGLLLVLPTLGDVSLPICMAKRANHQFGPVGRHLWGYFD